MPFKRRTRSVRTSSRKSGSTLWQTASVDVATIGGNVNITTELLPNIDRVLAARATIVRVIGHWTARAFAQDVDCNLSAGLYVLSENAFAGGTPLRPETDLGRYIWTDQISDYTGSLLDPGKQYITHPIDVKTPIRIKNPENRFLISVENTLGNAMRYLFFLRILLRWP